MMKLDADQLGKRVGYLDSLKGFAILLVALGHICAGYMAAQMYPSARGVLTAIHKAIYMFHMPLFMTISGYVFHVAYFTNDGDPKRDRIFRQTLNLIAVYFLFSLMLGLLKMAAARYTNSATTWKDILSIPVLSISPYWYLYVLVTLYLLFSAGRGWICRIRPAVLLPVMAFLSVLGQFIGTDVWFELGRTLHYSFFFALGVVLHCQGKAFSVNAIATVAFGVCACTLALGSWHGVDPAPAVPLVNLMLGFFFTLFFWGVFSKVRFIAKNRVLRLVGCYSLEIYVLHCIFSAGQRPVLQRLGVSSAFIGTVLNLICSVLLSVLLGFACKCLRIHELLFKPVSYFSHKSANLKAD